MQYSSFTGNRYEAAHQWAKHQEMRNPLIYLANENQRRAFTAKCLPIYQKFYPEILDEIQGIADGWQIPFEDLVGFLLSMYCFDLQNKCTCFAFLKDQHIVFGRNSDFLTTMEDSYDSCYYKLEGAHAFIGNTTAMVQMEDGVNEYGLAIGLTFIVPKSIQPGLNAGMLVRYLLEKCKSVKEAISALENLPIASSQTLTLADRSGAMAVVECNCEKMAVIYPEEGSHFIVAANRFQSKALRPWQPQGIDDWHSDLRYQTVAQALSQSVMSHPLLFANDLLSGKYGFICQYDRKTGHDTVWSVIYDLSHQKIYLASGNPAKVPFLEDQRLAFQ